MAQKSWQLGRRDLLKGAGVTMALPFLDAMAWADSPSAKKERPRRFCSVYFPYGVALPKEGSEDAAWNWYPEGEGKDFTFRNTLRGLEPLRKEVTILKGLSHANGRKMGGHDTADTFLTGALLKGPLYKNTISLDQRAALEFGDQTRYSSLVMSSDGGIGEPTRSSTLSFTRSGQPIPALNKPKQIFDRLFGVEEGNTIEQQRRKLDNTGSLLDLVLEHSKSVRGKLGAQDQRKFDEYLYSVRAIEQRVERSEKWLEIPKPEVDADSLDLSANHEGPKEYIRSMFDLIYLSYLTDSTRLVTYQVGSMNGATSIAGKFPTLLGISGTLHNLAHGAGKKGGAEKLGKWHQFLTDELAHFMGKLQAAREGDGTILDHTIVLYGSSNSNTHNNNNYPLMLGGGSKLGFKHNQFLTLPSSVPLANLHVSILDRLNVPIDSFSDSKGEISEVTI